MDLEAGADALLSELMSRGRDASGIMAVNLAGEVFYEKAAVDAREFIAARAALPEGIRAIGVHTRMATKGSKGWNRNNHPVVAGEALVMHNGVVDDDDVVRETGHPEVDSYALAVQAYHAREKLANETDRAHASRIAAAMAEVDGSAACIVAFIGQPVLYSLKLNGSPLYYASTHGVRIAASTRTAIEKCADAMGLALPGVTETITRKEKGEDVTVTRTVEKIEYAQTGRVLSWHGGSHSMQKIEVPDRVSIPKSWSSSRGSGAYGAGYTPHSGTGGSVGRWIKGQFVRWDEDEEYTAGAYTNPGSGMRPVSQIVPSDGYPDGTPQPGTLEGDALARKFKFWRSSEHGRKWARENTTYAAAYDAVAARKINEGKVPPFPTKGELAAMEKDPLFTAGAETQTGPGLLPPSSAEKNDAGNAKSTEGYSVSDESVWPSVGEITAMSDAEWEAYLNGEEPRRELVSSETYEAIASRMLEDPSVSAEPDHGVQIELEAEDYGVTQCDLCDSEFLEGEPATITSDGLLCDDCFRTYQTEGMYA